MTRHPKAGATERRFNTATSTDNQTDDLPSHQNALSNDDGSHSPNHHHHILSRVWGGPYVEAAFGNGQVAQGPTTVHRQLTDTTVTFYETVTLDGFPRIFEPRTGLLRKFFWLSVFSAAGIIFFVLVIPMIQDYVDKRVNSEIGESYTRSSDFPEIEFCPNTGIQCSCRLWYDLHRLYQTSSLLLCADSSLSDFYLCLIDNEFLRSNQTAIDAACPWPSSLFDFIYVGIDFLSPEGREIRSFLRDQFYDSGSCGSDADGSMWQGTDALGSHDISYFSHVSLMAVVAERNLTSDGPYLTYAETKVHGSPLLQDMLWECKQAGVECNDPWTEHIKYRYSPTDYDYCMVINTDENYPLELTGTNTLELVFDLMVREMSNQYFSRLSAPTPKVYMYERGKGQDLTASMFLNVGQANYLTFEESHIKLLEDYGTSDCSSQTTTEVTACLRSCVSTALAQDCCDSDNLSQCALLVHEEDSACMSNTTLCSSRPMRSLSCLGNKISVAESLYCTDLVCQTPCSYKTYVLSNQLGRFPNPLSAEGINKFFGRESYTDQGLIQLKLFRTSGVVKQRIETPKQTLSNLVGTVGGNLGLWCGISIMTLAEYLEYLAVVSLILVSGYACRKTASPSPDRNDDSGL